MAVFALRFLKVWVFGYLFTVFVLFLRRWGSGKNQNSYFMRVLNVKIQGVVWCVAVILNFFFLIQIGDSSYLLLLKITQSVYPIHPSCSKPPPCPLHLVLM